VPEPTSSRPDETVILVSRSTSTLILCTCRQIYAEANPVVQRTIENWLVEHGVSMVVSLNETGLCVLDVIMQSFFEEYDQVKYKPLLFLKSSFPARPIPSQPWDVFQERLGVLPVHDAITTMKHRIAAIPSWDDGGKITCDSFSRQLSRIDDFIKRSVHIIQKLDPEIKNEGFEFMVRRTPEDMDWITYEDYIGFQAITLYLESCYDYLPMAAKVVGYIDSRVDPRHAAPSKFVEKPEPGEDQFGWVARELDDDEFVSLMSQETWKSTWVEEK
jgi:hypothetical protein